MISAIADCFFRLEKKFLKKSPYFVPYKKGDLPILWSFNLEALMKCTPNSTVALILACSVRQELPGHLGPHSAQCRKHITWYCKTDATHSHG